MSARLRSMLAVVPLTMLLAGATIGAASAHQPATRQLNTAVASTTITIHSYMFSVPSSVPAGATVTVVNQDSVAHTVTATNGAFDVPVAASSSASFTAPGEGGTYAFVCSIHPDMHGTLTVAAAAPPGGGSGGGSGGTGTPPTGPVQAGDGGSVAGSNSALELVGLAALLAALGAFVMWRRTTR